MSRDLTHIVGVCTNSACFVAKTKICDKEMAKATKRAEPVVKKAITAAKLAYATAEERPNPITKTSVGHLIPSMVTIFTAEV